MNNTEKMNIAVGCIMTSQLEMKDKQNIINFLREIEIPEEGKTPQEEIEDTMELLTYKYGLDECQAALDVIAEPYKEDE